MTGARRRGGPLRAMAALLGGWTVLRLLTWTAPQILDPRAEASAPIATASEAIAQDVAAPALASSAAAASLPLDRKPPHRVHAASRSPRSATSPMTALAKSPVDAGPLAILPRASAGEWSSIASAEGTAPDDRLDPSGRALPLASTASRWSADAWLLYRRKGAASLASGLRPASYGGSQAGAVLRYRLKPGSGLAPTAYLRATTTLRGPSETQAAVGLSARPMPSLPIVAAAELRATDGTGRARLQPAIFAVTELAPIALPAGVRAEFYAQAGYVAGRDATPFADGQLRIDRALASAEGAEARVGGGLWAGAQRGASRVDLGPGATVGLPLGPMTSARLAFDWRFRVAGDAEPRSGAAVTLSAGF